MHVDLCICMALTQYNDTTIKHAWICNRVTFVHMRHSSSRSLCHWCCSARNKYELFLQSITDYNYRADQCRLLSRKTTFLVNDYK